MKKIFVLFGVVALSLLGCGSGEDPVNVVPMQSNLVGTWTAPFSPPQPYSTCAFGVTFNSDGTFGAGVSCTVVVTGMSPTVPPSFQVDVDWQRGAFTSAPSGRINFLASEWPCAGGWVSYAEYSGTASRPTITLAPPSQDIVLVPSASPPFTEDAVFGCFDSDWTFAPSPIP